MRIRRALPEDYENLLPLFEEVDANHRAHHPLLFKAPDGPARDRTYYQSVLESEGYNLLVGELDGALVGLVVVIVKDAPHIPILVPRRFAVIDNLVVRADLRRSGYGEQLMEAAHDLAREAGATSVELNVFAFNQSALRFYEQLGYGIVTFKMSKRL
ncbi:MAG: GNAT family N-acetyltransferase [Anaerolineales bacterium]|nr:GNAT family N-acetyltransferase [Anaerolineales bacterium]